MEFRGNLSGTNTVGHLRYIPVYSASAISAGAALMRGVTTDVDLGVGIPAASGVADFIGVTPDGKATSGVYATGTVFNDVNLVAVNCDPSALYEIEYDQTDTVTATSSSGTTVTIGSLEANISGGWLYVVAGTGAGQLRYIVTSTSGSCTTLTAFSPALDNTSTVIKILPQFHLLAKLISAATKIGTDAAAGSADVCVWDNFIQTSKRTLERLQPGTHSGMSGLSATGVNARFFAHINFRDHVSQPAN